jgi:hypothetical protein
MNAEEADNKSNSAFICVYPRPISLEIGRLKNRDHLCKRQMFTLQHGQ